MNDETLIKKLLDGQKALFIKVDQINETLVKLARIEERQVNDRDAISRLGAEMRVSKSNCGDKIDKLDASFDSIKDRVSAVENISGNRGVVLGWLQSMATALIIGGITFWVIKK